MPEGAFAFESNHPNNWTSLVYPLLSSSIGVLGVPFDPNWLGSVRIPYSPITSCLSLLKCTMPHTSLFTLVIRGGYGIARIMLTSESISACLWTVSSIDYLLKVCKTEVVRKSCFSVHSNPHFFGSHVPVPSFGVCMLPLD